MSFATVTTRIAQLEAKLGLFAPAPTITANTFPQTLQHAQNRFDTSARTPATAAGGAAPAGLSKATPGGAAPAQIDEIIQRMSAKHGVDPALVKAVARAESGFRVDAGSPAGAQGVMQLMPATARGLGVRDLHDPEQNIEGGVKYLAGLLRRFRGDETLALAGYNAGPNAVAKYGGVPPYAETQTYVQRVLGFAREYGYTAGSRQGAAA